MGFRYMVTLANAILPVPRRGNWTGSPVICKPQVDGSNPSLDSNKIGIDKHEDKVETSVRSISSTYIAVG